MGMHLLAVEYPGYGLYKSSRPDEAKMREDADTVFEYLTRICGVREQDIILWGRSMGSGPSSYLASRVRCHSLLLMSAYTSIRDVARGLFGWAGSFLAPLTYERFRNKEAISQAKCPIFVMHGLEDTLIPYSHAEELNAVCPTISFLHLVSDMDHNEFKLIDDLVRPFQKFLSSLEDAKPRV